MININIEGDVKENNISFSSHRKYKRKLFNDLLSSLLTVQGRKHIFKTENEKNDDLTDSLKDKGLYVADQSRFGRSGSDKQEDYDSGELDIVICDSENYANLISIIEAFELSSVGKKNRIIKSHIDKLLFKYDTAGNIENFVVIYSKAKRFDRLWQKYKAHINDVIFPKETNIKELELSKSEIKAGLTEYHRSGKKLRLYHIFVNMYIG
ncbi:MAG: hypothetical protein WD607_10425 [Candidatus Paceibacterota bacterium]